MLEFELHFKEKNFYVSFLTKSYCILIIIFIDTIEPNGLPNFRTMFDKTTYFGFIASVFIESFGSIAWTMGFIAPLILYMGLCSYIVAHAMDFKTIVVRLDDQVTTNRHKSKRGKKLNTNINTILNTILIEAFEAHHDLYKYGTDWNLIIFFF